MIESREDRTGITANSSTSKLRSSLFIDSAFIRRIEKDPGATWRVAVLIAAAGAGRGVTPGLEAGWVPLLVYSLAGLMIWLLCASLVWNVAHRIFNYAEGFVELARVVGLSALPLLGLWLNVIPAIGGSPGFSIALHVMAFIGLFVVLRSALSISNLRVLAICALSFAMAILLLAILGIFLVGDTASGDVAARIAVVLSAPDLLNVLEEPWKSSSSLAHEVDRLGRSSENFRNIRLGS